MSEKLMKKNENSVVETTEDKLEKWKPYMREKKLTINEAAEIMGVSSLFLRKGLQEGIFPFGTALKTGRRNYSYLINPADFERYIGDGGRVLPSVVAAVMGKRTEYIRYLMQQNKLPIGWAIRLSGNSFTYYISEKMFKEYLEGKSVCEL